MQGGDVADRANQLDQSTSAQKMKEVDMSPLLHVLSYIFFPPSGPPSCNYSFLVQKWTLMLLVTCLPPEIS